MCGVDTAEVLLLGKERFQRVCMAYVFLNKTQESWGIRRDGGRSWGAGSGVREATGRGCPVFVTFALSPAHADTRAGAVGGPCMWSESFLDVRSHSELVPSRVISGELFPPLVLRCVTGRLPHGITHTKHL